jgi:hypothetical protein
MGLSDSAVLFIIAKKTSATIMGADVFFFSLASVHRGAEQSIVYPAIY